MKNFQLLLAIFVFTSVISNRVSAQSGYGFGGYGGYDDIEMGFANLEREMMQQDQMLEQYNRAMEQQIQQMMQESQRLQAEALEKAVAAYRKENNDYQTSDEQVLEILWQEFLKKNPNYIANANRAHQVRMDGIANFGRDNTKRHIGRMRASERNTQNFVNNVIWERGRFVNPNTGDAAVLPYNRPGTFHTDGNNSYYSGNNNRMYQGDGNGFYSEMTEEGW